MQWQKIYSAVLQYIMLSTSPVKIFNPSFGLYLHTIRDKDGNAVNRCDTAIFRNDLDFDDVVNFIDKKYADVNHPKILNYACSDGEEIYSLLSIMDSMLGEKVQKFYPITAKDINSEALKLAQKGVFYFTYDEYQAADHYLKDNLDKYFTVCPKYSEESLRTRPEQKKYFGVNYKISEKIKDRVKFEKGNIMEDVQKIDFKNTVLLARNFWAYLSEEEIDTLAKTLSNRMDNSSTLIIGDYDVEYGVDKLLKSYGFVETEVDNVFELPKNHKCKKNIYDYEKRSIYEYKD